MVAIFGAALPAGVGISVLVKNPSVPMDTEDDEEPVICPIPRNIRLLTNPRSQDTNSKYIAIPTRKRVIAINK